MNQKLSSRILLPNLIIVIGSLLLLCLAMFVSVRVLMREEAEKSFVKARATVELLIRAGQSDLESAVERINRIAPALLIDAKTLILTEDMQYTADSAERPLDEAALRQAGPDGDISSVHSGDADYFVAAIPFSTSEGSWNMLLYTSLDNIDDLIRQLALAMLLALAGASLIAVLASIFASRRIAGPLRRLSLWAHGVGGRQYGRFELRSGTV
jgi:hypothetical protein